MVSRPKKVNWQNPSVVRILVGTLLEVGRGTRQPEDMPALLEARDRRLAGPTAPPEGLCLMKVDY